MVKKVIAESGIDKGRIAGIGISNQRETAAVWDRETGCPVCNAIVWQCARGADICKGIERAGQAQEMCIRDRYWPIATVTIDNVDEPIDSVS